MAAAKAPAFLSQLKQSCSKVYFNRSGYNKYGLLFDDLAYETPAVKEALRRLPQQIKDVRTYRIIRAAQLSLTQTILPKEQWTKYEEDEKYLEPYVIEVEKEEAEKKEWNSK